MKKQSTRRHPKWMYRVEGRADLFAVAMVILFVFAALAYKANALSLVWVLLSAMAFGCGLYTLILLVSLMVTSYKLFPRKSP